MGKRVNTTVKERKALLKELGYTEEEMANFYNEAAEVNPTIKSLVVAGYKWTDLAVHQMRQLPGLKERTLQILAEKEAKIKADKEKAEQAEQNRKYYIEHFEELMLEKIDNKEELTKSELEKLVIRDEICTTYGDNRRWSRVASTIVKIQDRTFEIEWDEGLTESQPNMFDSQPVEVEKHVYHELVERVQ